MKGSCISIAASFFVINDSYTAYVLHEEVVLWQ